MSTSPPSPIRDPLSALRIDRTPIETPRSGTRWGKWLIILLLCFGLGAGGYFGLTASGILGKSGKPSWLSVPDIIKNRPEVRLVRVVVEKGESADATVVSSGYLESRRQAKIGARAAGRIQVVNVEEGNLVKKDQVLAVLEHADLDASLAAVEATVVRARSAVSEQQIVIAQWKREYARIQTLFASNNISSTEHDQAKFQLDSSVARLESLKADVQLAEARMSEAEQLKENMFIRAPFDGTVISKDAEVGESILPGGMGEASGRGSAVTIADLEHLEVECDVKEDFINRIRAGQRAEVAVDAVPDRRYKGEVRKVIPMGDRARSTIKVKVSILDVDGRLFPDMSSTVYFLPADSKAVENTSSEPRLFCPADAVVKHQGDDVVWVVDAEGRAQVVQVTVGRVKDSQIEILSGLKGTERVVTKPGELSVGQPVKVSD